ncbi:hypothetical protein V3C99_006646 [Haemonchus contortus]
MFTTDDECTIVSVNNAMHVDAEEDLAISTKCKFYAAGSHVQNSSSYHEDSAPWNIILDPKRERRPKNETGEPKSYAYWKSGTITTDLRTLLVLKFGIFNVDNLIIGPTNHNKEFSELLRNVFYNSIATRFCQVNIIYQREGLLSLSYFLLSFHNILYRSSFFVIKTSRSADNKYLSVFAINFMEEYCVERYYKTAIEYQKKI